MHFIDLEKALARFDTLVSIAKKRGLNEIYLAVTPLEYHVLRSRFSTNAEPDAPMRVWQDYVIINIIQSPEAAR